MLSQINQKEKDKGVWFHTEVEYREEKKHKGMNNENKHLPWQQNSGYQWQKRMNVKVPTKSGMGLLEFGGGYCILALNLLIFIHL